VQSERCPWRGACYYCHLDEERTRKNQASS
jgi:hypothetical protein